MGHTFLFNQRGTVMERNESTTQQCPKCGNTIFADICPYCHTDVKQEQAKKRQQQTMEELNKMTPEQKTKSTIIGLVVIALIIALIVGVTQCAGNDSDTYSATCQVCHKTYSYEGHEYGGLASRNVKCIRMTNMCKKCYMF